MTTPPRTPVPVRASLTWLAVANALGAWLGGVVVAAGLGWTAPAVVGALLAVSGLGVLTTSPRLERRSADDHELVLST